MSLEEFSGGYYRTEMSVQPYDDGPVIQNSLYDFINREIYAQTDAPITMRVGLDQGPYFTVEAENAVPSDVLAMPREWMDDMEIHDQEARNVFVLKPGHSYVLNQSVKLSKRFDDHNVNTDEE